MNDLFHHHIPVFLHEAVDNLVTKRKGIYIDATFGRGNHSREILKCLQPEGQLLGLDKDPEAVHYGNEQFKNEHRLALYHTSFAKMLAQTEVASLKGQVDGILFDLGVSSPQLDNPERGFSFIREGKLDMRMDTSQGMTAAQWLASVNEQTLVETLWLYGEEKFSRRIARAIVNTRQENPITTTSALANLIKSVVPKTKDTFLKHPATRSFQAIRIAINQELSELSEALSQAMELLSPGGRLCVISFHSLEDRIVKQFIRQQQKGANIPRGLPIKDSEFKAKLSAVGKAIKPDAQQVALNPRARSAILRIAEKQS